MPLFTQMPRRAIPGNLGNLPSPGPNDPGPTGLHPLSIGPAASSIHRDAEKECSRLHSFRFTQFSETRLPTLEILGNRASGKKGYSRKPRGHKKSRGLTLPALLLA